MTTLPFTRIAILDRGAAALRAVHAVREYAWERGAPLQAVVVYRAVDRDALWTRAADDAVPLGDGGLDAAITAARADVLWASWDPVAPLGAIATLALRLGCRTIGAPPELLAGVGAPGELARLAHAADLPLAVDAAAAQRLRLDLLGDATGNVWVFGPRHAVLHRDGAPQVEELEPSGNGGRARDAAARLARAARLTGAATVELWQDPAGAALALAAFVPHLEPGHVLAEAATGLDLMKLQLRIAAGGRLEGDAPRPTAHAVAVHLAVEPPAPDVLRLLRVPTGVGLRVETGVDDGDAVSGELATLVARGHDRAEAVGRLHRALVDTAVVLDRGVSNKAALLAALAPVPGAAAGDADAALLCAALAAYDDELTVAQAQFYAAAARGRPRLSREVGRALALSLDGQRYALRVRRLGPDRYRVEMDGQEIDVGLQRHGEYQARLRLGARCHRVLAVPHAAGYLIEIDGAAQRVSRAEGALVRAPAPAVVLSVGVAPGAEVHAGDRLLVLEAMKTEMPVLAPCDGWVAEVLVRPNVQVDTGAPLLRFAPPAGVAAAGGPRIALAAPPPVVEDGGRNLAELRDLLLGFDVDPSDLKRLLSERAAACATAAPDDVTLRAGEAALLATFADIQALFRRRGAEDEDDGETLGTEEYLVAYLRAPGVADDTLPAPFLDKLRRAVAHYGVASLDPSPELAASLFRICQAEQRLGQSTTVARSVLERWLAHDVALASRADAAMRMLLDRLIAVAEGRDLTLCDLAREVRYVYCDAPLFAAARARVYDAAERELDVLATGSGDAAAAIEALVECAQPLVGRIARRLDDAPSPLRRALLEVMTRRYYRIRPLEDLRATEVSGAISCATGSYLYEGRRIHVLAAYAREADLPAAIAALRPQVDAAPAGDDVVFDLYVAVDGEVGDADATAARLQGVLADAGVPGGLRRVVVARFGSDAGDSMARVQHFTFRPRAAGYAEEHLYRGVHPMMGKRLHLSRLVNFDYQRLPSPEDVYLFRAVAHGNPKDERLFAIAEVRDLTPVRDATGRVVGLPYLERMLAEALAGLRRVQAQRPARERLYWNRVLLYVWPPLDLPADELAGVIRGLAPATAGLGIEQVVIRARMPDPATGALRDGVLRIANPSGRGLVITAEPPPDQPLQPMSEYEQKVVRMRQRGLLYPYELIRMLTPTGGAGDFPPGSFTEYDLDADNRLTPVDRPHGQNSANLVVGVIRNITPRYPEGMARVVILGDPSRSMGSVAEPECRRIDAALDLADALGVPVDWFALCSGAKIAMDSGTENMDWCARSIRRIVEFTQAGGTINILVYGINVGAQSYWNAEATMLMHTRGILIMTADGSMVLTGKRALDYSGGVSADDNLGIGGYERIMGPNGQAQYWADDLTAACKLLLRYYEHAYVAPGERLPRRAPTSDPIERDIGSAPHGAVDGIDFATIGDVLSPALNPGRKKPFDIRRFMAAAIDQDHPPLERWQDMRHAESAVIWDAHLGGWPVCVIGIECRPLPRFGFAPADGPDHWTSGTLFPLSSKKVARAINSASGNRPVVVLANLSGFDGSPESMRSLQLEYGAEIGRAVVNFRGPFVFCVISRYHGGAYVVFSKVLNERIESAAVEGSYASVIGGAPAAAVVFAGEVEQKTRADPRLVALDARIGAAAEPARGRLRAEREELHAQVHAEKLGETAEQFDRVHSVYRAQQTGALDHIIPPARLRPWLVEALERGIAREAAAP